MRDARPGVFHAQGQDLMRLRYPRKHVDRSRRLPFWLLLPGLLIIAAIQLYPSLFTFALGFQRIEPGTGRYIFTGLENFERLLTTRQFQESMMIWAGMGTNYHEYLQQNYSDNWQTKLKDGVYRKEATGAAGI